MDRLEHIQEQIDYHNQRKREALEVYYEANDRVIELEFQKRHVGRTAVRQTLYLAAKDGRIMEPCPSNQRDNVDGCLPTSPA